VQPKDAPHLLDGDGIPLRRMARAHDQFRLDGCDVGGGVLDDAIVSLLDIPVPIDSWEVFDHLFEWERRLLNDTGRLGTTYLGAAIRSFFAQGGRKCYVVRVDDPWTYMGTPPEGLSPKEARLYARCRRVSKMRKLIPGLQLPGECFSLPQGLPPDEVDHIELESSPADRLSWRGIGHIFGLPDISFLCLPDLPDAVRVEDGSHDTDSG
jgi:hypothetical protein